MSHVGAKVEPGARVRVTFEHSIAGTVIAVHDGLAKIVLLSGEDLLVRLEDLEVVTPFLPRRW